MLDKVFVRGGLNRSRRAEFNAQTAWIRRGMPAEEIPRQEGTVLGFNMKLLQGGCKHKHPIPVSALHKLESLKFLKQNIPLTKHVWRGDHNLLIWIAENAIALGTLTQARNEHCCILSDYRLCVSNIARAKHEVALYLNHRLLGFPDMYTKMYNYSVQGTLRKMDVLELAVQANLELMRRDPFSGILTFEGCRRNIAKRIENRKIISGLVRVAGKVKQGKAALYKSDKATINILGLLGVAILMVLIAMPITVLLFFKQRVIASVESSYRRSVIEIDEGRNVLQVPVRTPSIFAAKVPDTNRLSFKHTYRRQ